MQLDFKYFTAKSNMICKMQLLITFRVLFLFYFLMHFFRQIARDQFATQQETEMRNAPTPSFVPTRTRMKDLRSFKLKFLITTPDQFEMRGTAEID